MLTPTQTLCLYAGVTVLNTFATKHLLTTVAFASVSVLSLLQSVVLVACLALLATFRVVDLHFNRPWADVLSTARYLNPLPLVWSANIVLGLLVTNRLSLPMMAALRRLGLLLTLLAEWQILRKPPTYAVIFSMVIIMVGAVVAAFTDAAFDLLGYASALLNDALTAGASILIAARLTPTVPDDGPPQPLSETQRSCSQAHPKDSVSHGKRARLPLTSLQPPSVAGVTDRTGGVRMGVLVATEPVGTACTREVSSSPTDSLCVNLDKSLRSSADFITADTTEGDLVVEPPVPPQGCVLLHCSVALFVSVALVLVSLTPREEMEAAFAQLSRPPILSLALLCCLLGAGMHLSFVMSVVATSPLTAAVVGVAKHVLITYVGMTTLGGGDYIFSWFNFVGVSMSLGGAVMYAVADTSIVPLSWRVKVG